MEKAYFNARVLKSLIMLIGIAQHREGYKHRWQFFVCMVEYYFYHNHPDLFRKIKGDDMNDN